MNICLLNDSFPPQIDGVANTVLNYAQIINRDYGKALVAVPNVPGAEDNYDFDVVRYKSFDTTKLVGYRAGYPFSDSAIKKLTDFKPDIIHTHCPIASALMSRELRNLTGAPVIFTYHSKFDIDIRRAVSLKLVQDVMVKALLSNIEACDDVWVVNNGAGENLRGLGYKGDYHVMLNGVEFPKSPAPQKDIDSLAEKYGIARDVPVFLFVGRMIWYKGQKIIIDGLRKTIDEGFDFRMIFVGDGENKTAIEEYAKETGIAEKCIFTGSELDRNIIRAWYSLSDMLLLPSVYDNNPIVVKEASACSTASILVRGSSSAEGIEDGVDGILIEENADSMAKALITLCKEKTFMKKLGDAASDMLYFSWNDSIKCAVKRYEEVYACRNEYAKRKRVVTDFPIEAVSAWHKLFYGKNK